ncbi:MAG TPA: DUF1343 domain-containing protein [Bacteroidales bacterium]|jgi:uncharacterized protein YbbC (DUF1343 family)|nr:DUF1343 domain-containing protein [Bacteroidales bacterium]HNR41850.1 DUF1343 domain-containing protein [Bacteroidales bacterium]HPM18186.1 DUF1343 domain-containing protein [Bacteroidales bacterium]HQG78333.1 DUF1343 domain-containing protein [Bacteroidales bacterium]
MTKVVNIVSFAVMLLSAGSCIYAGGDPVPGAERAGEYIHLIKGRKIGVVANQTSMAGKVHLVDFLVGSGIRPVVIFSPEHGFRDMADAGEKVADGRDPSTGIPLTSLYGSHLKPTPADLAGLDAVIFDIQDVGARFYTYISTLHYVLEACAENNVRCIVLDRPNPNGFYIDGNVADTLHRTFVSMDPVPVVHGMTVGEYAMMLNGEGWLKNGVRCDLTVIPCENYTHETLYELPVKPSPNLPNQTAIYLYPSICFFEGTNISLGRGTDFPFQVFGSPNLPDRGFSFTPRSVPGAKNPPLLGVKCFGTDLRNAMADKTVPAPKLNLEWIISAYRDYPDKDKFFTPYFDVLAAGPVLREQIQKGMSAEMIRQTWQEDLAKFAGIREKYLLYR